MRKYLLAAGAAAVLATPAIAATNGPYVGVEGGVTFPQSSDLDVILNNTSTTPTTTTTYNNGYNVKYKTGYDVDAIAGYKLGLLRLEVEGGYKQAPIKSVGVSSAMLSDVGTQTGAPATASQFPVDGHVAVTSLMGNALLDFGSHDFGGYVGGGFGRAWTSLAGDKDNAWAGQLIAGVRTALTDNIDAGLKYRYFRTGKLNYDDAFTINGDNYTSDASGRYASHSLLASLVYNFNSPNLPPPLPAAAPAPPPPPAPPATQTCPDGSVILATSACPAPPPPPPPPPVERGERG